MLNRSDQPDMSILKGKGTKYLYGYRLDLFFDVSFNFGTFTLFLNCTSLDHLDHTDRSLDI